MSSIGAPSLRPRRFFVETWGCQMNELDSQRMAGQLMQLGILPTREPAEADVILVPELHQTVMVSGQIVQPFSMSSPSTTPSG